MADLATVAERKQALDEVRPLPLETAEAVSLWFETEIMLAEAALEGLEIERGTVERLVSGETGGLLAPVAAELANMKAALAWLGGQIDDTAAPLGEETVKSLHRLLRRGIAEDAGLYRKSLLRHETTEEGAAGNAVMLPRPGAVPMLMARLGTWLGSAEPGPEAAAEVHYRLLRIQPFVEHNGRVARLLMNLVLGLGGYPPLVIGAADAPVYRQAIESALVHQDKRPWQGFFLERLVESLDVCLVAAARSIATHRHR